MLMFYINIINFKVVFDILDAKKYKEQKMSDLQEKLNYKRISKPKKAVEGFINEKYKELMEIKGKAALSQIRQSNREALKNASSVYFN